MPEYLPPDPVVTDPAELARLKPLFASYLQSSDRLGFAVSWSFQGIQYLIGFVYKLEEEDKIACSRIIGFKKVDSGYQLAFVSDQFKNPDDMVGESLWYENEQYWTDVPDTFNVGGKLIVKTYELPNPDMGLHNIFLIDKNGLLDNRVGTSFEVWTCEMFEYGGKLLFQEGFWHEVTVQDDKLVFTRINDYSPYIPAFTKNDLIVKVAAFKDKEYNAETRKFTADNNIRLEINNGQTILTKRNFTEGTEDPGWGMIYYYLLKKPLHMKKGGRIFLLLTPGMELDGRILAPDDVGEGLKYDRMRLPGVVMLDPSPSIGKYDVQISASNTNYQVYIDVTD